MSIRVLTARYFWIPHSNFNELCKYYSKSRHWTQQCHNSVTRSKVSALHLPKVLLRQTGKQCVIWSTIKLNEARDNLNKKRQKWSELKVMTDSNRRLKREDNRICVKFQRKCISLNNNHNYYPALPEAWHWASFHHSPTKHFPALIFFLVWGPLNFFL